MTGAGGDGGPFGIFLFVLQQAQQPTPKLLLLLPLLNDSQKNQLHQEQYTHTHPFNGPLSGTTQVSRYQKVKTNLDFTEARDSEWQWHQLGHMQICTSLQTDSHASTSSLSFLQSGCPSCRPTNSVKALKALHQEQYSTDIFCINLQPRCIKLERFIGYSVALFSVFCFLLGIMVC